VVGFIQQSSPGNHSVRSRLGPGMLDYAWRLLLSFLFVISPFSFDCYLNDVCSVTLHPSMVKGPDNITTS